MNVALGRVPFANGVRITHFKSQTISEDHLARAHRASLRASEGVARCLL